MLCHTDFWFDSHYLLGCTQCAVNAVLSSSGTWMVHGAIYTGNLVYWLDTFLLTVNSEIMGDNSFPMKYWPIMLLNLTNICKRLHILGLQVQEEFCQHLTHNSYSGYPETNISFSDKGLQVGTSQTSELLPGGIS